MRLSLNDNVTQILLAADKLKHDRCPELSFEARPLKRDPELIEADLTLTLLSIVKGMKNYSKYN